MTFTNAENCDQKCARPRRAARIGNSEETGRAFEAALLRDLPAGAAPCGENGEFHTFVRGGPGFAHPVDIQRGEVVLRDERFCFCDLLLGLS